MLNQPSILCKDQNTPSSLFTDTSGSLGYNSNICFTFVTQILVRDKGEMIGVVCFIQALHISNGSSISSIVSNQAQDMANADINRKVLFVYYWRVGADIYLSIRIY